jgi:acyl-coenzyme A thioesterase PaaI-like protein
LDISLLPFNKLIGLEVAGSGDLMVRLPAGPQYLNHLGTVHGSALLAVAEAGSGEFLFRSLGHIENVVPVVRKLEAKFRKPANGSVTSRCAVARDIVDGWAVELEARGRVSADVPVEVIDSTNTLVLSAVVGWFITRNSQ